MFLRFAAAFAVSAIALIAGATDPADAQGYPYVRGPYPPPPQDVVRPHEIIPDDEEESIVMIPEPRGRTVYRVRPEGYVPPPPQFVYPEVDEPAAYGHIPGRGAVIQRGELPSPGVALPPPVPIPAAPMQAAPGLPAVPGQQAVPVDPGTPRPPMEITRQAVNPLLPPEDQPEVGEPKELPPHLKRQLVQYRTKEPAGTLVIDTAHTYLYLVLGNGQAMRYGIGVGRDGFTWSGVERVSRMAEWPDWHPPEEMIERQPYLPRFMAGGEGNPLGARALYLGKTLYRIHGTNQPSTIGTFVSSGCVRLTNADIMDLFDRVKVGNRVVVLPGKPPSAPATVRAPAAPAQGLPPTAQALPPATAQGPAVIRAR